MAEDDEKKSPKKEKKDKKKDKKDKKKGGDESPKKEKKKDKKEKKKKDKKEKDDDLGDESPVESPDEASPEREEPEDKKKDKKADKKKDKKKKDGDDEPAEADTDKKGRKNSMISQNSRVSKTKSEAEKSLGAEIQPYTPVIMQSDNPIRGQFMAAVTLDTGKGAIDGPDMVYGQTEQEVKLASALRREQMRQRYFDRLTLRDALNACNHRSSSVVSAADYWDGDMLQNGHTLSPRRWDTPALPTTGYNVPSNSSRYGHGGGGDTGPEGALRAAAACGDVPSVLSLLRSGVCKVNEPRQDGQTALHNAARHGHLDVIDILLEAGADAMKPDVRGRRPVDVAAQYGQRAAVRVLESKAGASPGRMRQHWHCSPDGVSPTSRPDGGNYYNPVDDDPFLRQRPSSALQRRQYRGSSQPLGGVRVVDPLDERRKLTEDVQDAMSGVTTLVRGWINEWSAREDLPNVRYVQPPPALPKYIQPGPALSPYAGVSPSHDPASGRISPTRQSGTPSQLSRAAIAPGLTQYRPPASYGRSSSPPVPVLMRSNTPPMSNHMGRNDMLDQLTAQIWAAANAPGKRPPPPPGPSQSIEPPIGPPPPTTALHHPPTRGWGDRSTSPNQNTGGYGKSYLLPSDGGGGIDI